MCTAKCSWHLYCGAVCDDRAPRVRGDGEHDPQRPRRLLPPAQVQLPPDLGRAALDSGGTVMAQLGAAA